MLLSVNLNISGSGNRMAERRQPLQQNRVTMAEVAAMAGVSMMTVSRVLNGHPGVAPETRECVERAIAESGFVRNRAARALRRGRTGIVDLVVPHLDSAYILEIMRGVEETLGVGAFRCAISTTRREDRAEREALARIADGGSDGALLVLARGQSSPLDHLRRRQIPIVVIDHRGELGPDTPAVGATNWSGAYQATAHLLRLGHRRIAHISGPAAIGCSRARRSGYLAALDAAGVPVDPALLPEADFYQEGGYRAACALLDLPAPPTAIFAGNDMQAMGVYAALRERGLRVPDEVSVVGFDDIPVASMVSPPLTTVRQPLAEMGRVAATMLLTLIDGASLPSPRVELATALMVRGSCAPPHAVPPALGRAGGVAGRA
jgi:LacI family transcriptional regulator